MDAFEAHRPHLHAVAARILGSQAEADDALQEAWMRIDRADTSGVENIGGWLTTVVSRVCLTMLDARKRRREQALEAGRLPDPIITPAAHTAPDPEGEALAADAVGAALLVVLETLQPAERLAFVLHDVFAVPFEDIALVVDRSPAAARQLASRARRRVQGADRRAPTADRQIVDAFLAAARDGDFEGLLAVLDPNVVLRADDGGGALRVVQGARAVAAGARIGARRRAAHPAVVDGTAGLVANEADVPVAVLAFTVVDGRITAIDALTGPARLAGLGLEALLASWDAGRARGAAGAPGLHPS
jgi:RNA polymerase sigma factor (sigma-70 family)